MKNSHLFLVSTVYPAVHGRNEENVRMMGKPGSPRKCGFSTIDSRKPYWESFLEKGNGCFSSYWNFERSLQLRNKVSPGRNPLGWEATPRAHHSVSQKNVCLLVSAQPGLLSRSRIPRWLANQAPKMQFIRWPKAAFALTKPCRESSLQEKPVIFKLNFSPRPLSSAHELEDFRDKIRRDRKLLHPAHYLVFKNQVKPYFSRPDRIRHSWTSSSIDQHGHKVDLKFKTYAHCPSSFKNNEKLTSFLSEPFRCGWTVS